MFVVTLAGCASAPAAEPELSEQYKSCVKQVFDYYGLKNVVTNNAEVNAQSDAMCGRFK
jgi:hypothetical protein